MGRVPESMARMTPDERLKELIDEVQWKPQGQVFTKKDNEILFALRELLSLRQQVKEWREDACRLAYYAECSLNCDSQCGEVCDCGCDDAYESHEVLLEKYPEFYEFCRDDEKEK